MWRVEVPLPWKKRPWLNSNDRDHWGRRKDLSSHYRGKACQEAKARDIPQLDRAIVEAYLAFGDNRRRDAHNYWPTVKACVDGLVDAGVLPDDSDKYIARTSIERDENNPKGVSLVIYEEGEKL